MNKPTKISKEMCNVWHYNGSTGKQFNLYHTRIGLKLASTIIRRTCIFLAIWDYNLSSPMWLLCGYSQFVMPEDQVSEMRKWNWAYPVWVWLVLPEVGALSALSGDVAGCDSRLGCASGASLKSSVGAGSSLDTWSCAGTDSGVEDIGTSWLWSWVSVCRFKSAWGFGGCTGSGATVTVSDSRSGLVSFISASGGFTVWWEKT